jgi:hypothetical protein
MAYLGRESQAGNFVKLDDISTQFNGSLSSFDTLVSGVSYTVSNPYATIVGANGAILNPGIDYNFSGTSITFATAPTSVWLSKFFVIVLGDVLSVGIPTDNTITNAKLVDGTIQYGKLATTTKATLIANTLIFGA